MRIFQKKRKKYQKYFGARFFIEFKGEIFPHKMTYCFFDVEHVFTITR